MCGIVGAVRHAQASEFLLEGLRRLEYRGYDSAGVVVINDDGVLERARTVGKVVELEQALSDELQLVYNKARQAAITQEISEIVSGAAAV